VTNIVTNSDGTVVITTVIGRTVGFNFKPWMTPMAILIAAIIIIGLFYLLRKKEAH
jgi:hypothetical protein